MTTAGGWPCIVVTDAMRARMPVEAKISAWLEIWPDPTMCFQDYDDAEMIVLGEMETVGHGERWKAIADESAGIYKGHQR